LAGRLAPAIANVEGGDRGYAIGGLLKAAAGFFEAKTEGADNAAGHDSHPASRTCFAKSVKTPHVSLVSPAILFAFQTEALYTMTPKGENSSSEVRRLSFVCDQRQSA
jgi:hypothetical protein